MRLLFKSILCFCLVAASAGEQTNDQSSMTTITPATTTVTTPVTTAGTTPATTAATTPATTPVSTPVTTAATTPVTTPATTPVTTPTTTPATTPVTMPATTPVTTPATTPVTTPVTTPATTPVTTPVTTPATTPITTPATTPVTTPVTTPATTPATMPVTTPATTPTTTPATTPATMPVTTPATTPATTLVTTPATTTKGPCTANPCIGNGICEQRHEGFFVCTCRSGLVYDNTTGCIPAKVFPGDLTLDDTFQDGMSDKTTELFRKTAEKIQEQLRVVLQADAGYLYSLVLSLKKGSIVAEVQNFYGVSSIATTESVGNLIKNISNATYNGKSVCDVGFCDDTSTTCEGDGTAVCTCRSGYIKSEFSSQSCFSCPHGEKAVDSETCKKCDFGFSGFNCKEPYLLVVVVVSCVLGTLLIIFVVALIVVSSRKQKVNSSQAKEDFSVEMHKPIEVPRIPRVNPTSNWQPANLEVTNSGSTEALVTKSLRDNKARYTTYDNDSDDGRNGNHDPPVYGGVRVMENGLRGNQNPYYRQDEDRMRRY